MTDAIRDDDEMASVMATHRALFDLIERHNLQEELEELHEKYMPEEVQKRREWWAGVCERKRKEGDPEFS